MMRWRNRLRTPRSTALRSAALAVTVGLAAVLAVAGSAVVQSAPAAAATTAPFFGTLATDPAHALTESQAGIKVGMLELGWDAYEPVRGQFDANYAAGMRSRMSAMSAAGMRVTLALGLHMPPSWVYTLPDSRFRNQSGQTAGQVNLVFNQALRREAELYLARVAQDFGMSNIWAIRLTSGGDAEVLYPSGGSYWAFDANAQNGPNMPPTMSRNPFPGWRPGTPGRTSAEVTQWADWYIKALDNTVDWQMSTLSGLGFSGYYQVLTPGSGRRPDGFAYDVTHNLPNGLTGVGAVWDRLFAFLPNKRNVVAYVSSMADLSGADDSCQAGDLTVPISSTSANSWSASRWISRIADQYGLPKAGENPGWNQPTSLNGHYVDLSSGGMLAGAVRQLTSCRFQGMYWAHDDKIWDNTMPFSAYSAAVAQVNPGGGTAPAFPGGTSYVSVDDVIRGTGTNQFAFTGGWSHCTSCGSGGLFGGSTSWSGTTGDTVRLSFTGTSIRLYGERDPRHGIGAVAVDGGTATRVDYYAPTRSEGQLVWSSPLLPYGSHVLTVRVTGARNAVSSGTLVPVDRVVVGAPTA